VVTEGRVDTEVLAPVAGAFEGEYVGVVDDPVDHGGGDDLVAEDGAPAGERQVGGQDERGVFVARGASWKNRFAASCSKGR
jgi:hypothetical protein